jgi:hypothetical protein
MGDWLGLIFIVGLLVGALVGLSYLGRPPKRLTEDEFERRVKEAQSAGLPAALHAVQKLMDPQAAKAVEVQKDLRAGFYDDKEEADDDDDEAKVKTQKAKVEDGEPA